MPLQLAEPVPSPASANSSVAGSRSPLRAVIVYADDDARKRAIETLVRMTDPLHDDVRPLPWRFDTLETVNGRVTATLDLAKSEILVVSMTAACRLPAAIEHWLMSAFGGLRGTTGLLVALPGEPGQCASVEPSALQLLRRAAELAGWDFLAPESVSLQPVSV